MESLQMEAVSFLKRIGLIFLASTLMMITLAGIDQNPVQAGFGCGCGRPPGGRGGGR
jgi:hypothetical protein